MLDKKRNDDDEKKKKKKAIQKTLGKKKMGLGLVCLFVLGDGVLEQQHLDDKQTKKTQLSCSF